MCSDPFWGVRKSCAEVIHPLAQVCSKESRWNILSPCLIHLLQDQSRWVRAAALRVLGYFISTFARSNDQAEEEEDEDKEKQSNLLEIKHDEQEVDDLCFKIDQNLNISEADKFNDFHYWRNAPLTNIEDVIQSSDQR